jgi:hypothetical protein
MFSDTPFLPGKPLPPSPDIRRDPGIPGAPVSDPLPNPVPDPTPDPTQLGAAEPIGATDDAVGDRTGPAVGYDQEPEQEHDKGGVA